MTGQASSQVSTLNTLKLKFAPDIILTCLVPECGVPSSIMAGVVASKVRRARVKSLIDKEDQIRKASIAIIPNPGQERFFVSFSVIVLRYECIKTNGTLHIRLEHQSPLRKEWAHTV